MLIPQLTRGTIAPDVLVDLHRLPGAARLRTSAGATTLGAMVSYTTLIRDPTAPPLLRHIAQGITGGPQIRNQGTIAGSACYANPASEMPTALVASGAIMRIAGPAGTRSCGAADFFDGAFTTRLAPNEALVALDLPASTNSPDYGYCKIKRSESSWPIATATALTSGNGMLNLVLGAAVTRPVTITVPPEISTLTVATIDQAVEHQGAEWWADELADIGYRRRVAIVALTRALASLQERIVKRDRP